MASYYPEKSSTGYYSEFWAPYTHKYSKLAHIYGITLKSGYGALPDTMCVEAKDGLIYISKEQAKAFFDLVNR